MTSPARLNVAIITPLGEDLDWLADQKEPVILMNSSCGDVWLVTGELLYSFFNFLRRSGIIPLTPKQIYEANSYAWLQWWPKKKKVK